MLLAAMDLSGYELRPGPPNIRLSATIVLAIQYTMLLGILGQYNDCVC